MRVVPYIRLALAGAFLAAGLAAPRGSLAATLDPVPYLTSGVINGNDSTSNTAFTSFVYGATLSDGSSFVNGTLTLQSRVKDGNYLSDEGFEADGWLERLECNPSSGTNTQCNEFNMGTWVADGPVSIVVYKAGRNFVAAIYDPTIGTGQEVEWDTVLLGLGRSGVSHISVWSAELFTPTPVPLPPALALLLGAVGGLAVLRRRA